MALRFSFTQPYNCKNVKNYTHRARFQVEGDAAEPTQLEENVVTAGAQWVVHCCGHIHTRLACVTVRVQSRDSGDRRGTVKWTPEPCSERERSVNQPVKND